MSVHQLPTIVHTKKEIIKFNELDCSKPIHSHSPAKLLFLCVSRAQGILIQCLRNNIGRRRLQLLLMPQPRPWLWNTFQFHLFNESRRKIIMKKKWNSNWTATVATDTCAQITLVLCDRMQKKLNNYKWVECRQSRHAYTPSGRTFHNYLLTKLFYSNQRNHTITS